MKECPTCKRCFPDETANCPDDGNVATTTLLGEPTLDGRYLLERRLGQGGMGVVFKGRHAYLKTLHAIKVILPDLVGNDPMLTTRFRQEALAAAAIRHQNVISVTDFGVAQGKMPFLVMEFIKGTSLHEILQREGPMQFERAWEFIAALAAGVGAAHRQKIIHRDLKPLNVMVEDDVPIVYGVKILDFGLAKIKSGELLGSFVQAQTTGLMGSPYYMAPEQWSDEELDARADVYSLGVILYQMLCGEVPFKGSTIPSVMKKHLTMPPPRFQSFGVSVPPGIEAVVRHALEKEVGARIDSVDTFLTSLRTAIDSANATARSRHAPTLVDIHKTDFATTPLIDTQQPVLGGSTQAPLPLDTQLSTSEPSMPAVSMPPRDTSVADISKPPIAERSQPLAASVPPSVDPEITRVRDGSSQMSMSAPIAPTRSGVPPQLVIDLPGARRSRTFAIVGAAALVLLIVAAVSAYLVFRPKPTPDEPEVPTWKAQLVAIDGGTFLMGRDDGPLQETPAHAVEVAPFSMDKTEVTNAQYAEFVAKGPYGPPGYWGGNKPPAGQELWPVVGVSFEDANAFAAWRSKRDGLSYRLPTEDEWEYAARNGANGDLFPWGSQWQERNAVIKETAPGPVGSLPVGQNKWGVVDLIGNVWEWTSSRVSAYPGNSTVIPEASKDWVVIRGGGYASDPQSTVQPLSSCMREFIPPATKNSVLGFRLVRSGK
ncbi:MAG TPA: bifunctional serine/threonine-protein kinase/formylglycine-generating enzyme family protein [Pyrinomonadaceae bacterium]|nr:bifunctional serine/threonine-protein kinase/formylglycine-generating enzyme family protein [Pyrinomonadaceae bacterium]